MKALSEVGATQQVQALLARDPATHVKLDDALGVAKLLYTLSKVGAGKQVEALLARDPAAHVVIPTSVHVMCLLVALTKIGVRNQIEALRNRDMSNVDDPFDIDWDETLPPVDADDRPSFFFDFLRALPSRKQAFRYGRDPESNPASLWSWLDLT